MNWLPGAGQDDPRLAPASPLLLLKIPMSDQEVHHWLSKFPLDERLRADVASVMNVLPAPVREDFTDDPGFRVADYEPGPGVVVHVAVGSPGRNRAGRAVVLKRTLRRRPEAFIRYVIAHELVHGTCATAAAGRAKTRSPPPTRWRQRGGFQSRSGWLAGKPQHHSSGESSEIARSAYCFTMERFAHSFGSS